MKYVWFIVGILIITPTCADAQIVINEIMYDLEGTDTDREWLEIKHTGTAEVDISLWKFFENNSNHALVAYRGSAVLNPGEFAVVVDSPETFLTDWPGFTGTILDTSWSSFSNSGETFSLKDQDGVIVHEISYTPEMGALGDGMSLQMIEGALMPASPTPGAENQLTGQPAPLSGVGDEEESVSTDASSVVSVVPLPVTGFPKRVFVGEEIKAKPVIYNESGKKLFKNLFIWNFGNGEERRDEYLQDFSYRYEQPGTYVLYLRIYEGGYQTEVPDQILRQTIQVLPVGMEMKQTPEGISLKNKTLYEIDLSDWTIDITSNIFHIPDHTIVLPGKEILFSYKTLSVAPTTQAILYDAQRTVVASLAPLTDTLAEVTQVIKKSTGNTVSSSHKRGLDLSPREVIAVGDEDVLLLETGDAQDNTPRKKDGTGVVWYLVYGGLILAVIAAIGYMYVREEEAFIQELDGDTDADEYSLLDK